MASLRLCSSLRTVEASRLSRLPSNYVSTLNTRPIPRTTTRLQTRSFRQPPQPQQQQQQQPPPPSNTSPNKPVQSASSYSSPSTTSTPQQKPQQQQQTPADRASRVTSPTPTHPTTQNISQTGLSDKPLDASDSVLEPSTSTSTSTSPTTPSPSPSPAGSSEPTLSSSGDRIDWTRSFHGLSAEPFPKETADILLAPTDPEEVEIKPDGIIYLPEIKYRRILNRAFGPGGWGLVPRSESIVTPKMVTREYALVCNGRLVSVARGEQDYFTPDGIPTATEGCRSNALVRCCKDLGIASELWDPRWIRKFKAQYARDVWVEHVVNKKKTKIWIRKGDEVTYPYKAPSSKAD